MEGRRLSVCLLYYSVPSVHELPVAVDVSAWWVARARPVGCCECCSVFLFYHHRLG